MSETVKDIIEINKRQREFYNNPKKEKNFATKIWSGIRNSLLSDYRKHYNIKERVYAKHKEWLTDIEDKKVLDLGCLYGNHHTMFIAKNAKAYVGIDLSDKAIASLKERMEKKGITGAKVAAVDFLSDEFDEKGFDLVYAYGVLHHFSDFDMLLDRIDEKLNPNGEIILYDPLQTNPIIWTLRQLYRPFQSDKDWEWPFSRKTIKKLEERYDILAVHGILGKSKWGIPLGFLPLSKSFKKRKVNQLIEADWNLTSTKSLYNCMHTTMRLRRK